jgi:hypothetical protein
MTPSVVSALGSEYTRDQGQKGAERPTLAGQANYWLTPNTPNGGRSVPPEIVSSKGMTESGKRTVGLESQSRHWPTPVSNDDNKTPEAHMAMKARMKGGARKSITSLQVLAQQWPTPATRDVKGSNSAEFVAHCPFSPRAPKITDGQESSSNSPTSPRRLNPAFAGWLMGCPWWWTNPGLTSSAQSEMASYRYRLRQHLSSFFGDQGSG